MLHTLILSALVSAADPRCAPMLEDFRVKHAHRAPSGLRYIVMKPGARKPAGGQVAIVSYLLCLPSGKFVDASAKGAGFAFALGERQVVRGFEEAVRHLGLGGQVEAWLPARLAYGAKGSAPAIKPNAQLMFRISLDGMSDTALSLQLKHAYDKGGLPAMRAAYARAAAKRFAGMYAREDDLNSLGYRFIKRKKYDAAIAVLTFNAQRFPQSWNSYDSLGDAYNIAGRKPPAIENYKKALDLNPKDQNAVEQLKKLQSP
jgi:hypothetical protein